MKNKVLMKTLSALLAVVMVICSAPLSGFVGLKFPEFKMPDWFDFSVKPRAATDSYKEGLFTYSVSDGKAEIIDCDNSATEEIEIPSTLGGFPVVAIGKSAFSGCESIMSITMPDTIQAIYPYAFKDCSMLESVTLSNNIKSIGNYAFCGCIYLSSVTIPDSVTDIGSYAFENCSSLTEVINGSNVSTLGSYAFSNCIELEKITLSDSLKSIASSTFFNCHCLKEIVFPGNITSIGDYAFSGCSSITSITIPDSVTRIDNSAFAYCSSLSDVYYTGDLAGWCSINFGNRSSTPMNYADNLYFGNELVTELDISDEISSVGRYAFSDCSGLTKVTIGENVTDIGDYAFYGCTGIKELTMPLSVYYYSETFYNCKNIEKITLTKGTGEMAVKSYSSFPWYISENNEVIIQNGITNIESYAFAYCKGLTSVTIPDSVTNIENNAFYSCSGLKNITIPDSVTSIGSYAFYGCYGLKSITIPDSVTTIGNNTFANCGGLTNVTIPDSVTSIGDYAFYSCEGLTNVTIPDSVTSIGNRAFYSCEGLTSITIPDSVTSIGDYAFSSCDGLASVTIPDSVTSIGDYAFAYCKGLTSVTIPGSVTSIGRMAFYDCANLIDVYYTGDAGDWCRILFEDDESNPMYYADNLYFENELVTELVIPDGVTSINEYAFYNCSDLTKVTIGNDVTDIGNYAFYNCTGIKELTMPVSAKIYNSQYTFASCKNIEKLVLTGGTGTAQDFSTSSIQYTPWYISRTKDIIIEDGVEEIGAYAFYQCYGVKRLVIGDSLKELPVSALYDLRGLESISVSENNEYFLSDESNVLFDKDKTRLIKYPTGSTLTSYKIPDSVLNVETDAFYLARNLTELSIPASAEYYRSSFNYCDSLSKITISPGTTGIMTKKTWFDTPWYNNDVEEIVIEEGVTVIPDGAFELCEYLLKVTIPDSVTTIGNKAFRHCIVLNELNMSGENITKIGSSAFQDCYLLSDFTIPKKLTEISGAMLSGCRNIRKLVIPDGVTYIGPNAFSSCAVEELLIPDGVTEIGSYAFAFTKITNITIPDSVKKFGNCAFQQCTSLTDVYYNGDIADWCSINFVNETSNPMFYATNLYFNGNIVENIVVPDGVTSIGDYTFYNFSGVESITIPASVTNIGKFAFFGVEDSKIIINNENDNYFVDEFGGLYDKENNELIQYFNYKNIPYYVIPEGVTSISERAFENCTELTSITIPKSMVNIGEYAFNKCTALVDVNYTGDISDWCKINFATSASNPMCCADNFYLNGKVVTDIEFPNDITSINNYSFLGFENINSIVLSESITSIGNQAFYACRGLTSLIIPDSVTSIGNNAFNGCTGLESVSLSGGLTSLSSGIFSGCTALTSVTIPENITSIDNYVFSGCSSLKELKMPASLKYEDDSFSGCVNIEKIVLSKGNGVVSSSTTNSSSSSILYKYTPWYISGAKEIILEDGITKIGYSAFYRCAELVSVQLPESLTTIDMCAFEGCAGLTSVVIPENVTTIGGSAFEGCTSLANVTLPKKITVINSSTFMDCKGLTSIVIPEGVTSIYREAFRGCAYLTSVTIPDSVTELGSMTFYGCSRLKSVVLPSGLENLKDIFISCTNLASVTIPKTVTNIDLSAFYKCYALANIYYAGTEEEWNKIKFVSANEYFDAATVHFNSDSYDEDDSEDDNNGDEIIYDTENFEYRVNSDYDLGPTGSITITGYNGDSSSIAVPTTINGREVSAIGESAFENRTDIEHVRLSGSLIDYILDNAFKGCTNLKSVILPENVMEIGNSAFENCTSLTTVTVYGSLIGADVFKGCTNLNKVVFNSVETGESAFEGCSNLKTIIFGEKVREISIKSFYGCVSLNQIVVPDTVNRIESSAFENCTGITRADINCNYDIQDFAFMNCTALEEVIIGSSVSDIYSQAFQKCSSLKKAVINNCGKIGSFAFADCSELVEVTLGEGVTLIDAGAFSYCESIESFTISDGVESVGYCAFEDCTNLETISIGKAVKFINANAFETGLCSLKTFIVDNENEYFCSDENGVLFNKDKTEIVKYPPAKEETTYTIPESVTCLGDHAFFETGYLKTILMPVTVKTIGESCFYTLFETSSVSDIYYDGYNYQWEDVTISDDNYNLFNGEIRIHFRGYIIVDDETDVEIEYDDEYDGEVDLEVDKIPDDGQIMLTNDQKEKTNAVIYDISTLKDGMIVQPNGKIIVRIPAPENYTNSKIFVFYIDNTINGREWIPARIIDGYVVFEVDHFSLYAVADLDFTFSLDNTDVELSVKNNSVQLSPVIDSEIAISGYTIQWISSDETVATVDENGLVTRTGSGECTITAMFNEDETKTATCKITSPKSDPTGCLKTLRGTASIKSYKGEEYIAITMASGRTMTGLYKDMVDGGTVELIDICGTIQSRDNDYVAYQSQNKTNPTATMKVTFADGTAETYPVVFELYDVEREIPFNPAEKIKPIRGKVSKGEDSKGEYILVEMLEGQSSVGVYKASLDGTTATLDGAEGMFTEQEKLYIFYGSQNTINPEGRLTVTEADGTQSTYRVVFKMYEMDPYVNAAKGLRPVRGAVTFDDDGTIRIKMASGQKSVGIYKTMANGATFKIIDANGRVTNNSSSIMFYMTNNVANVTATIVFTLPDGTTKEQKIIFDMGLASDPDPLTYLNEIRGTASYQNDGTEDYIEVKASALSTGVGLYKDCLVKYTITDADGIMAENDSRYYVYKSQNPNGMTANINFLQSDGSYKTYKVKFVF